MISRDFGDKGFSNTNSPVVTKSWSTAGEYVVRCLVSDMKGKTASDSVIVRVGSPATFRISGTVSAGGQPLANVRVGNSLTGSSYRGTFTDSDGTYTITGLAAGTYTIAPSLYGYSFTTLPVTVGPTATGQDFVATDTPAVSLTMSDSDCGEAGVNIGKFTLTRTGSTAAALTVNFYYPSGTASKGTDYTLAPDLVSASSLYTATIPAGQATLDLVVTPVDDATAEGLESIRLELLPGTGYVVSGSGTVTMILQDNDSALPVVSLRPVDTDATEAGDPANFLISRTGATTSSLTVQFAASGTATNGTDYANIGTQIVIPAGASSVPLTISPTQDTTIEGDESVTVTISTNAAYIRDAQVNAATAYIVDDDIPIVTIAATDAAAAEAAAIVTIGMSSSTM